MLTYALALPTTVLRWSLIQVIWNPPNQMWVNWNIKWEKCPIWVPPAIILQVPIAQHPHLQCLQLPVCDLDPFPAVELDQQDYWKNKTAVLLGNFFNWYENSNILNEWIFHYLGIKSPLRNKTGKNAAKFAIILEYEIPLQWFFVFYLLLYFFLL